MGVNENRYRKCLVFLKHLEEVGFWETVCVHGLDSVCGLELLPICKMYSWLSWNLDPGCVMPLLFCTTESSHYQALVPLTNTGLHIPHHMLQALILLNRNLTGVSFPINITIMTNWIFYFFKEEQTSLYPSKQIPIHALDNADMAEILSKGNIGLKQSKQKKVFFKLRKMVSHTPWLWGISENQKTHSPLLNCKIQERLAPSKSCQSTGLSTSKSWKHS